MRQIPDLPKVLSGRGQLFQDDRSPIDVRYQIVLAVVPTVPQSLLHHAAVRRLCRRLRPALLSKRTRPSATWWS